VVGVFGTNQPTTGSPSIFCSQKKEPWISSACPTPSIHVSSHDHINLNHLRQIQQNVSKLLVGALYLAPKKKPKKKLKRFLEIVSPSGIYDGI
jgi:hypothetical protein